MVPYAPDDVVEFLVDGPSSLLALFGDLKRYADGRAISLARTIELVREAEERGWVEVYMLSPTEARRPSVAERAAAEASYRASSTDESTDYRIDEIGLWCRLSDLGRERWRELPGNWPVSVAALVKIRETFRGSQRIVVVEAPEAAQAESTLDAWKREHPNVHAESSRLVEHPIAYELRSGVVVREGVRIVAEFHRSVD